MAEISGFHNSINGDRKVKADFFARFFGSLIGNGVFPNPSTGCQVIANNDMTVTVKTGKAWINGVFYENTADMALSLDVADGVLKRIDRVVLQYNTIDRTIAAKVKKGTFASSPVAPSLQRDADAYELGIADILVSNGVISVTQANITDLRLNTTYCGIVHGVVDQVDTTTIFNQYQAWFGEFSGDAEAEFNTFLAQLENALSGDVAGNLLVKINENTADILKKLDRDDYVKSPGYATSTGSANTYIITLDPAPTAYIDGMGVVVKINVQNTGASTINVNGLGAKSILDGKGNAMTSGKLKAGTPYTLRYNGTNFILQGEGASGNATASDLLSGKTASTDAGDITGTLVFNKITDPIFNLNKSYVTTQVQSLGITSNANSGLTSDSRGNYIVYMKGVGFNVYNSSDALIQSIALPTASDTSIISNTPCIKTHISSTGKEYLVFSGCVGTVYYLWAKDITDYYASTSWVQIDSNSVYYYFCVQDTPEDYIIWATEGTSSIDIKYFSFSTLSLVKTLSISFATLGSATGVSSNNGVPYSKNNNCFIIWAYVSSKWKSYWVDQNGSVLGDSGTTVFPTILGAPYCDLNDVLHGVDGSGNYIKVSLTGKIIFTYRPYNVSGTGAVTAVVVTPLGDAIMLFADSTNLRFGSAVVDRNGKTEWSYCGISAANQTPLMHICLSNLGQVYGICANRGVFKGDFYYTMSGVPTSGNYRVLNDTGLSIKIKETAYKSGLWSNINCGSSYQFTTNTLLFPEIRHGMPRLIT